jgi:hypothetical protein
VEEFEFASSFYELGMKIMHGFSAQKGLAQRTPTSGWLRMMAMRLLPLRLP